MLPKGTLVRVAQPAYPRARLPPHYTVPIQYLHSTYTVSIPYLLRRPFPQVLSYLDFFPTGVQRTAVATAANICRGLSASEHGDAVATAAPILIGLLQYQVRWWYCSGALQQCYCGMVLHVSWWYCGNGTVECYCSNDIAFLVLQGCSWLRAGCA